MSTFDSLIRYAYFIAGDLPTQEQRENFVDFVSHAHSWYKHISPYPPGTPFCFFLNKYAGYDRRHGTAEVAERTQQGFHYSAIPTNTYRAAFGCLDFTNRGKRVPLVDEGPVAAPRDQVAGAPGKGALIYGLPVEILDAGTTRLTGVIHTLSAGCSWVWDDDRRPDRIDWPEESGGMRTLEQIIQRCRVISTPGRTRETMQAEMPWPRKGYPSSDSHLWLADPGLHELLVPERRRQQAEIRKAIDRVCELVEHVRDDPMRMDA
jgi:hypothetical protein